MSENLEEEYCVCGANTELTGETGYLHLVIAHEYLQHLVDVLVKLRDQEVISTEKLAELLQRPLQEVIHEYGMTLRK
jgi:hypothetical protein